MELDHLTVYAVSHVEMEPRHTKFDASQMRELSSIYSIPNNCTNLLGGMVCVMLVLCLANPVLGVWSPFLAFRRPKSAPMTSASPDVVVDFAHIRAVFANQVVDLVARLQHPVIQLGAEIRIQRLPGLVPGEAGE